MTHRNSRAVKYIEDEIESKHWYRQGGALTLYYISAVVLSVRGVFDPINFFHGKNCYNYFNKDAEESLARRTLATHIKNPQAILKNKITPWRKLAHKLHAYERLCTPDYLESLPEQKLVTLHERLNKLRVKYWKYGVTIEPFDPWGDLLLEEALGPYAQKITQKDKAVLTGRKTLHYAEQELLALRKITLQYKQGKSIERLLRTHQRRWFWLENSWHGTQVLPLSFFEKRMLEEAKTSTQALKKHIFDTKKFLRRQQKRIFSLCRKYKLPLNVRRTCDLFQVLTDWRDERKKELLRENGIADVFLQEFSRRSGIDYDTLEYLNAWEVTSFRKIRSLERDLKKRKSVCMFFYRDKQCVWLYGKEARQVHKKLMAHIATDTVRGSTAYAGKTTGRVRIISTKDDFKKMKDGDVLVTQMTRPEFVPLIRRACAIVTDEGGMTCHAAIISRELKIPCIVGTQHATSSLRDGELVEVDAMRGIVNKI